MNFTNFGQFSDGSLYFQWDESSDSKRVFILSRDLKVTEVLDGGWWARLMLNSGEFEGANYLLKQFYVKTTDENIIVDEKGETVGSYTLTPSDDDADDYDHTAVDWIMWRDGSENTVTVTRGQAPGEPAPDSSDGSGSSSGAAAPVTAAPATDHAPGGAALMAHLHTLRTVAARPETSA